MPTINLKFKIKNLKFAHAFTLIEILVVVAIMAVLTGSVLYSTNNTREKGKDARRKADMQAVASALVAYYADYQHYPPTSLTDNHSLDYTSYPYGAAWIPDLAGYLDKLPKDPLQTSLLQQIAQMFQKPADAKNTKPQVAGATNGSL